MFVTELGIVIDVKRLQPAKVLYSILVTELGIVTDVNPLQSEKADSSISLTVYSDSFTLIEDGIVMSPEYSLSPFVTIATFFFGVR